MSRQRRENTIRVETWGELVYTDYEEAEKIQDRIEKRKEIALDIIIGIAVVIASPVIIPIGLNNAGYSAT